MARHSHWHNIQATKGKADAKRAKNFAKLSKSITVAAKEGGGDPTFNIALRVAIDAARSANMPKDNIERAVARGTGEGDTSNQIEEVMYEGFGPGGSALLVQCLTDNRNRSVSEVRTVMMKNGGTMAGQGSVSWMFEYKGIVLIEDVSQVQDKETFELSVIDAGAEDIQEYNGTLEIVTPPTQLKSVIDAVEDQGVSISKAALHFVAKDSITLNAEDCEILSDLIDKLEELDDVDTIFTNEA